MMNIMEDTISESSESRLVDLVRAEKLALLYRQSYPAIFVSLFSCLLLSVILWPVQQKEVLISWVLILSLTTVARIILFIRYYNIKPQGEDILVWEKPYFISLFLSSITWGIGAVYIMPIDSQVHQVLIYYFLIGMCGGAISVYSAHGVMTLVTITCLLLPVTAWFLLQHNLLPVGAALGAIIFYVSVLRAGKILSSALDHSLSLAHELKNLTLELSIAKEKAEAMALIDELSNLNNRRAFYEKGKVLVDDCQRNNENLSIILMDIDDFKQVNDTLGHAAGDAVLVQVGSRLKQSTRNADLCARVGGEEFGILVKTSGTSGTVHLAEKLRKEISETPFIFNNKDISLSASFGVTEGKSDLDTLFNRADTAMYKAKQEGRNRVVVYDNCTA